MLIPQGAKRLLVRKATLVPEVFLDFSSSQDSCLPLCGSLTALSCGEKSGKTSGTRVEEGYM